MSLELFEIFGTNNPKFPQFWASLQPSDLEQVPFKICSGTGALQENPDWGMLIVPSSQFDVDLRRRKVKFMKFGIVLGDFVLGETECLDSVTIWLRTLQRQGRILQKNLGGTFSRVSSAQCWDSHSMECRWHLAVTWSAIKNKKTQKFWQPLSWNFLWLFSAVLMFTPMPEGKPLRLLGPLLKFSLYFQLTTGIFFHSYSKFSLVWLCGHASNMAV